MRFRPCRACLPSRFARDTHGAVSIAAALLVVLGLGLGVLVIDAGHLYLAKRRLQAAVDAAALSAAGDTSQAAALAAASLARNGFPGAATVETGGYTADPSIAESARFDPAAAAPNAVRVTGTLETSTFLTGIFGMASGAAVKATATAARIPGVSFSAGSGLATLSSDQMNQVLGGLFRTGKLKLTAANYDALASADIDALTFLDQLATRAGVSAGTYGDLADANVTMGQLLTAATAALNIQGGDNSAALEALNLLSLQLPPSATMTLGRAIDLALWRKRSIGSIVQQDGGQTRFNLLDITTAAARLYGAGHIVSVDVTAGLPLAGTVTVRMAVGSPMAGVALSPVGTSISTAQVRLALTVQTGDKIGLGSGSPVFLSLPVYLQIASGTATASAIPCAKGGIRATITAAAQGGIARIGTVSDADLQNFAADPAVGPAAVATVTLLFIPIAIAASGGITIAGGSPTPLDFTQDQIDAGTPQTAAGSNSGHVLSRLAGSLSFPPQPGTLSGVVLGLLDDTVLPALKLVLVPLLTALDPTADTLLRTLGLRLGAIDVAVHGVHCGTPTLVH